MDLELALELLKKITEEALRLVEELKALADDSGYIYYLRLVRLMHLLVPILAVVLVYYYFKYLLIFNAYRYEEYMRKRYGHMKKLSRQLKHLAKRYGNIYFCYMPMNHGTLLPRPYTLFVAIKEVLLNSNRPATRDLRTNLLENLIRTDQTDSAGNAKQMNDPEAELFAAAQNDLDPLSEYNLDIMKSCRELIIQGVKDFDVMSTVYRVMESVVEDAE